MKLLFTEVEQGQQFTNKGKVYTKIDKTMGVTINGHVKFFNRRDLVLLVDN
jgi:hypothetical protein